MDAVIEWLPRIGAIIMLLIGVVGFFKPQLFTGAMGIEMTKPDAWSEMRTVMGGLNIGLGLGALIMNRPEVYMTIGLAWVFALLARTYSIFKDDMTVKGSMPAFILDGGLAVLFLSGLIF